LSDGLHCEDAAPDALPFDEMNVCATGKPLQAVVRTPSVPS